MAYDEHVAAFFDDMGGGGEADGEDLVAGAVDMKEGLWYFPVIPFQYGIDRPADEAVVAVTDDVEHESPVRCRVHGEGVFGGAGGFEEGGRDQFAHTEAACDPEVTGEVVGYGNAANNDCTDGPYPFGDLDGHHSAEG